MSAIQDMRRAVYTLSEHGRDIDCQSSANQYRIDIIVSKKRRERWRPYGLRLLPPGGGGWEGGTVRTVCPQSARPPRLPPSCLPPLGGGPRPWPCGGGVSSACASLLFPIMSIIVPDDVQSMENQWSIQLPYPMSPLPSCPRPPLRAQYCPESDSASRHTCSWRCSWS